MIGIRRVGGVKVSSGSGTAAQANADAQEREASQRPVSRVQRTRSIERPLSPLAEEATVGWLISTGFSSAKAVLRPAQQVHPL